MTVPEGLRTDQIATLLGSKTKFSARQFRRVLAKPAGLGLPSYAQGNPEGYLFPATYELPPDSTPRSILRSMVARYESAVSDLGLAKKADALGYSVHDVMTVASIVQAEGRLTARLPEDRPGHLQPAAEEEAAAARHHDRLHLQDEGEADHDQPAALGGLAVQHLPQHRPAADADRGAGGEGRRGGALADEGLLAVLRDHRPEQRGDELRDELQGPPEERAEVPHLLPHARLLTGTPAGRRRCAVLGSPVAHSLSPVLHRAAYDVLGLDWVYDAHEVDGAGAGGVPGRARRLLARAVADDAAQARRAAAARRDRASARCRPGRRTPWCSSDGRRVGHNTDVPGVARGTARALRRAGRAAVVLGGGATAASALLGLADLGCRHATLLVRDAAPGRRDGRQPRPATRPAGGRVRPLAAAPRLAADIVVSTIPAAAQDDAVARARGALPGGLRRRLRPVADAARPRCDGRRPGLVSGLDLLVHQAVLQVELMTGVRAARWRRCARRAAAALAAAVVHRSGGTPPRPGATPLGSPC